VVAIPGASSVAQLESNVAAAEIDLTDDEWQALRDAAVRFRPATGPATLPRLLRARMARVPRTRQSRADQPGEQSGDEG
jgi:hypothetical protein